MFEIEIQTELDKALRIGDASYNVSKGRDALILSVKNGSFLISLMDKLFSFSDLGLVSNVNRSSDYAVPMLTIDKYAVFPKFEHKKIEGHHIYELSYSEHSMVN